MPKQKTASRQNRPPGPYDIRPLSINPTTTMADYMTMPHSPAHWNTPHIHYQQPSIMSMQEYLNPMPTPTMTTSGMPVPTPNMSMHHHQSGHSRQPSSTSTPWTNEEDSVLLEARSKGMSWHQINQTYFSSKSGNACRKRHERLLVKRRGSDWDDNRMERLAVKYKEMRKEIWTPLASQLGEKWEHVEKICMQQGLKTLTNKASNHARNQSSMSSSGLRNSGDFDHSSSNEEFDDSGIGLGVQRNSRHTSGSHHSSTVSSIDHILHPPVSYGY